jgi:HEAT repeat protein
MGRSWALAGLLATALISTPATAAEDPLEKMGRQVTQRAAKDFKSKDPEKRRAAAESLSGWKTAAGTTLLIQGLADVDARVRAEAARSLASYDKEAEPARAALERALDDPQPAVVAQAAEALERALGVTEKRLGAARLRVLDEGEPFEQFLAARGLTGQAPPARLVAPILAFIEKQTEPSEDYKVRNARGNNLEIGQKALEHLVETTKDRSLIEPLTNAVRFFPQRNDVPLRALSLFEPRPKKWAELLVDQLESRETGVLREALFLMGRTAQGAGAVAVWAPEAATLERHRDPAIRRALIYALGEAGGLASAQIDVPLRALDAETDADLRQLAAEVIGEIGDRDQATPLAGKRQVAERATPALRRAIEKDADPGVREKATRALARLMAEPSGRTASAPAGATTAAAVPAPPAAERRGSGSRPAPKDAQSEARALETLRARGEKLDQGSFYGALGERDTELVQAYLDAGLSVNDRLESTGDTPLRYMLRAGACSPLQRPTAPETKALVRLLLARGADVNLTDTHGNTPLMEAAMQGCDRELMGVLIKAGAKVGVKNSAGLSAFEMGLYSGHDGLEELIAAGYRLPADKVEVYRQGYASNPKSIELIRKASAAAGK